MKAIKSIITLVVGVLCFANSPAEVRVHCEADREKASQILEEVMEMPSSGERIIAAARALKGVRTGESALHDTIGSAEINLHELSPLDFASTVLAFAKAASTSRQPGFDDFADSFVNLSRRRGEDGGFASRLFYSADWTVDNIYRGNLTELTDRLPDNVFRTRSFDHYTSHRDLYPALRDSDEYEKVRMVEMGYRSHKVPYMKKQTIGKKDVKEIVTTGDVIILLSKDSDGDIQDIGFIEKTPDGNMYLIHSNPSGGFVKEENVSLERFFKLAGQYFAGYRLLHPTL
ncbi:MAG: DUF1460 domain-containing protein [Bacteroidales bacterium]|nr:DUF1460 domain-containing protein [Bacteroidales bacterium]